MVRVIASQKLPRGGQEAIRQERPNVERDHVERSFAAKIPESDLCDHQCPLQLF